MPLPGGGGDVANHVAHDVGDDKSADGGGDENGDSGEDVDDEAGEGEAVGSGETAGEAEGSEDEDEEADHGERVGDGGDHGEALELGGCQDSCRRGMDGHGDDAADGAGDQGDAGLTIVCHVKYCREKTRARRGGFALSSRYGTKKADMSGNADAAKAAPIKTAAAKVDRRILRTRDTLGDALVELMQEKAFDEITVQEVLDRAGVGRSTFYAHYRDKDDLFLSDVEDFFELVGALLTRHGASLDRVAPVGELFAHIAEAHEFYTATVASGKMKDVLELGRGYLARSIEERLLLAGVEMEPVQLKAHAHALAGALFSLLEWWIDHGMAETPKAMDALFHRMVWNGVKRTRRQDQG
jgi:AcrR family transcriptional regulator